MNLQNILNFINDSIRDAQKEKKRNNFEYWQGYTDAMLIVEVQIKKKIQAKLDRKKTKNAAT